MSMFSIGFEMSDALMAKAAREDCMAFARELVAARDVVVILASAVVFVLAVDRQSHWLWWLAGLPPLVFGLLGMGWLFAYVWLPRASKSRIAHLPHRRVQVEASEAALSFQTATERLEVAWTELKALKRRPNFWIVCLLSGMRIPSPVTELTADAVSFLEAKLTALGQREHKAG